MKTDLQQLNDLALDLVQAAVGSITPNFRRIWLELKDGQRVRLGFLLEQDIASDKEEIEEIVFEFEALQERALDVELSVLVDSRPLEQLEWPSQARVVFGRHERAESPA